MAFMLFLFSCHAICWIQRPASARGLPDRLIHSGENIILKCCVAASCSTMNAYRRTINDVVSDGRVNLVDPQWIPHRSNRESGSLDQNISWS